LAEGPAPDGELGRGDAVSFIVGSEDSYIVARRGDLQLTAFGPDIDEIRIVEDLLTAKLPSFLDRAQGRAVRKRSEE
jgi:hypothetical protein